MTLINQPTLRPTRKMAAVGWTSLLGPISMAQTRGTYNSGYQVNGAGRAQISITSTYRAAQ